MISKTTEQFLLVIIQFPSGGFRSGELARLWFPVDDEARDGVFSTTIEFISSLPGSVGTCAERNTDDIFKVIDELKTNGYGCEIKGFVDINAYKELKDLNHV